MGKYNSSLKSMILIMATFATILLTITSCNDWSFSSGGNITGHNLTGGTTTHPCGGPCDTGYECKNSAGICYQKTDQNCTCTLTDPCSVQDCSSHGTCSVVDDVATCTCTGHYSGDSCDTCADGYAGDTCSSCADGYHANDDLECVADTDLCEGVTCSDHGSCSVVDNSATCTCTGHYSGDSCDTCATGYTGTNCDSCIAGYNLIDGACKPVLVGQVWSADEGETEIYMFVKGKNIIVKGPKNFEGFDNLPDSTTASKSYFDSHTGVQSTKVGDINNNTTITKVMAAYIQGATNNNLWLYVGTTDTTPIYKAHVDDIDPTCVMVVYLSTNLLDGFSQVCYTVEMLDSFR